MSNSAFLYPSVTSLPGQSGVTGPSESRAPKKREGQKGEFDQAFEQAIGNQAVKEPLKFSSHATQRLRDRQITLDQPTMIKVNEALDKAEAKGIEDSLILTKDAALIVSVKNRTVITALDRNSLSGNVFTNIDGAVIV